MHLVSGGGGGAAVASFVGGLNRLIPPTTTITSASTGGSINGGHFKPATSTLHHQLAPNGVTDQISIQPASITTTHRVGSKRVVAVEDTGKVLEMVGLPEFDPSEAAPTDSGKAHQAHIHCQWHIKQSKVAQKTINRLNEWQC